MPSIRSDLSIMPLSDFLAWLSDRDIDGILTVDSGTNQGRFAIVEGKIIRAQATEKRTTLGQFLVNANLITEDQLQRVLSIQSAISSKPATHENAQTLGHYLVERGFVSSDAIEQALHMQINELALETMLWDRGVFVFNQIPVARDASEIAVAVAISDLCREAKRREPLWAQHLVDFDDKKAVIELGSAQVSAETTLDGLDTKLLSFAACRMTVESAFLELHAPVFQTLQRLSRLKNKGLIVLETAHPDEPTTLDIKIDEIESTEVMATVDHGQRARRAFEAENYSAAYRHAHAKLIEAPKDEKLRHLRHEAQARITAQLTSDLPALDAVPRLRKKLVDIRKSRRLSAKEHYILSRVDGKRSLEAIVRVSPMRDIDAFKLFHQFVVEDVIGFSA